MNLKIPNAVQAVLVLPEENSLLISEKRCHNTSVATLFTIFFNIFFAMFFTAFSLLYSLRSARTAYAKSSRTDMARKPE